MSKQPAPGCVTVAQAIAVVLGLEVLILIAVDLWLAATDRQVITAAVQDDNSRSGQIVGGVVLTLAGHLVLLPYLRPLYRGVVRRLSR